MAGTITALKAQRRAASGRVNVHLDGEFAFGLALIHALWLKVGQMLSDAEIAQLKSADSLEQAMKRAVNFVAYRPRTVLEVKRRLSKTGAQEAEIEGILTRLKETALLDDASFSEQWVDSRLRSKPRSKKMLAWELKQKGVDAHIVEAATAAVDDNKTALSVALARLPRLSNLPPLQRKQKLVAYLARQGYSFDIINAVVNHRKVGREWTISESSSDCLSD